MKKTIMKTAKKAAKKPVRKVAKKKYKLDLSQVEMMTKDKSKDFPEVSQIANTKGAEMPNPGARNRPPRKDVRFAFR